MRNENETTRFGAKGTISLRKSDEKFLYRLPSWGVEVPRLYVLTDLIPKPAP